MTAYNKGVVFAPVHTDKACVYTCTNISHFWTSNKQVFIQVIARCYLILVQLHTINKYLVDHAREVWTSPRVCHL